VDPIIDNAPYVHHYVAYFCSGEGAADKPPTALRVPYDCLNTMEVGDTCS
jgi:hypothetical protein